MDYNEFHAVRENHSSRVKKYYADGGEERRYQYSNLSDGGYVIDVGGYQGDWAAKMLKLYPKISIITVSYTHLRAHET